MRLRARVHIRVRVRVRGAAGALVAVRARCGARAPFLAPSTGKDRLGYRFRPRLSNRPDPLAFPCNLKMYEADTADPKCSEPL